MKLIRDPRKLQALLQKARIRGKTIGFVPTMGALHEGHLSLVAASNRENAITVVSIFVNPTQFGANEDYSKYPRVFGKDKKKLLTRKVDYLFCPSVAAMYPEGFATFVGISPRLEGVLCGKFRPGHFRGVATVVAKLLNIVGACRLYLGAKDYQQTVVVRRFVGDLDHSKGALAIVQAILGLGRALGMQVVAEGVETETQLAVLTADSCDEVQGFYLGRPMTEEARRAFVAERRLAS